MNTEVTLQQANKVYANGDFAAAEYLYRKFLKKKPNDPELLVRLGHVLVDQNDFEEALKYTKHLVTVDDRKEAKNTLAYLHAALGHHQESTAMLEDLMDRHRDYGEPYFMWAQSQKFKEVPKIISRLEEKPDPYFAFAAGKVYDDVGDYQNAWKWYQIANRRCRQLPWKPSEFVCSNQERQVADRPDIRGTESDKPIFIVGMARSGTSLCERILASHFEVDSRGERQQMKYIMRNLDMGNTRQLADAYVNSAKCTVRFTDKNTSNWAYLPQIRSMFPNATIIQTWRDPMDTCLSCYFQPMPQQRWSFDPIHCAIYNKWHRRLTNHWADLVDYVCYYQDLTENPEKTTQELLAACDLPWNDACLDHTKSEGAVDTASHWQSRQKIYKTSVSRHKNYPIFCNLIKEYI